MAPSRVGSGSSELNGPIPGKESLPPGVKLVPLDKIDTRPESEIVERLQIRQEVTSEKNIWAFWHSGLTNLPPWARRNVIDWVRRLGPEWTVHLLDLVPGSKTHAHEYVDKSWFPTAFNEHTMDGPHWGTHAGDLVRLPLLWLYGGIWIDVGMILLRHVDDIFWKQIEDPSTPYELAGFVTELRPGEDWLLNGFLASRKQNIFVKKWHEVYCALWDGGRTNAQDFRLHPLLKHLTGYDPPSEMFNMDKAMMDVFRSDLFADYAAHFLCFERVSKLVDPVDGFNGPKFWPQKFLTYQCREEMYHFMEMTAWSGTRQVELLSKRRVGENVSKDKTWYAAENFVNDVVANTAVIKLSHGPKGSPFVMLADIWDSAEYADKHCEEGTFGAYLRYASLHFDQTRDLQPVTNPRCGVGEIPVYHVGHLEPVVMVDESSHS